MKSNILFLGVGKAQLPAIKYAVELGLGVIGFDGNPEAIGFSFCDHAEVVDIKDPDKVEQSAIKWNKKVGIDGVMAPAVEVGISVGRVVDKLGLRGIGEKTAIDLTDKIRRRIRLDEAGILQPKWGHREEKKARLWTTYPCVVKPRDQAGAKGVRLVEKIEDVGLNYDLLEEYLEGWEVSVEVLVFEKGRYVSVSADRNYDKKLKWKPYLLEDGCSLPSKLSQKMSSKIDNLVCKIIAVFNLSECAIKLDLLIKDNRVYVIEIAPRLGGGQLSSTMIPLAFRIDWWKAAICLAMGMNVRIEIPEIVTSVAQRYVFPLNPKSHHDRITDFIETGTTVEEAILKAEQRVKEWEQNVL